MTLQVEIEDPRVDELDGPAKTVGSRLWSDVPVAG